MFLLWGVSPEVNLSDKFQEVLAVGSALLLLLELLGVILTWALEEDQEQRELALPRVSPKIHSRKTFRKAERRTSRARDTA